MKRLIVIIQFNMHTYINQISSERKYYCIIKCMQESLIRVLELSLLMLQAQPVAMHVNGVLI